MNCEFTSLCVDLVGALGTPPQVFGVQASSTDNLPFFSTDTGTAYEAMAYLYNTYGQNLASANLNSNSSIAQAEFQIAMWQLEYPQTSVFSYTPLELEARVT